MKAAMLDGHFGILNTPASDYDLTSFPGVPWAADNGAFSDSWDAARWWDFLERGRPALDRCLFAVAPDVVGDPAATLARSTPWLDRIAALGYPVAYVAQDGATVADLPWPAFDVLFIGGAPGIPEWKDSLAARALCLEATARAKRVHVGRVNTRDRLRRFAGIADTVDGTFLRYGPDTNVPRLLRYLADADRCRPQGVLELEGRP